MKKSKLLAAILLVSASFLFANIAQAQGVVKKVRNDLSSKNLAKYGVNPWSLDTDNDGYTDAWEVKNGYCPTNAEAVRLESGSCTKGKFNLTKKSYTPPAAIKDYLPRDIKKFSSCADLKSFLGNKLVDMNKDRGGLNIGLDYGISTGLGAATAKSAGSASASNDYSPTNIQVEGVDESDTIKTDGKYIYTIVTTPTGDENYYNRSTDSIVIIKATPADQMKEVGRIVLDKESLSTQGMFLSGKYLVLLFKSSSYGIYDNSFVSGSSGSLTVAKFYDVSNPAKPQLARTLVFDGSLIDSRLSQGNLYLVMNYPQRNYFIYDSKTDAYRLSVTSSLPRYYDGKGKTEVDDKKLAVKDLTTCANVHYFDKADTWDYLVIAAIPVNTTGKVNSYVALGSADQIYMSLNNLFVIDSRNQWNWYTGRESTDLYKFSLKNGKVEITASQNVPGTPLNQFSLDENSKGYLRLFTTQSRSWSGGSGLKNNLYVLDSDLNRVGWYEGFGEGERIYSARFMGDRAYVVTYQQTDPLFVFDVSSPRTPKLAGELVLPGFSTYLHPYDNTHLIGIGYNTNVSTDTPWFTRNEGLKIGLFDVADPNSPIEIGRRVLGSYGTFSQALYDHHAFLFSRAKNLLAFPITTTELPVTSTTSTSDWVEPKLSFDGLYAFGVSLDTGFSLRGAVTHQTTTDLNNYSSMFEFNSINRSLYIGNYLYAISGYTLTSHNLGDNLNLVQKLDLSNTNLDELENNMITRAHDSKRLSDLKQLQTALELFYTDNNNYPVGSGLTLGIGNQACLNVVGWQLATTCSSGSTMMYMGAVPSDPNNSQYIYTATSDRQSYTIKAHLKGKISGLSGDITVSPSGIAD